MTTEETTNQNPEPASDQIKHTKFEHLLFDKGITLKEIHEATGISYPTLVDLKKGRNKNYRPRTLRDVATYLDVTVNELLENEDIESIGPFDKLLKERGLTLNDVHEATGISYPILQDIKQGKKKNYRERTLNDVATYLDVTPKELFKAETSE